MSFFHRNIILLSAFMFIFFTQNSYAAHIRQKEALLIKYANILMLSVEDARIETGRELPNEKGLKLCEEAINYYEAALSIPHHGLNPYLASIYRNMSLAYYYLGEWDKGIIFREQAMNLVYKITDHKRMALLHMERAKKISKSSNGINLGLDDYRIAAVNWSVYLSLDTSALKLYYEYAAQVYTVLGLKEKGDEYLQIFENRSKN